MTKRYTHEDPRLDRWFDHMAKDGHDGLAAQLADDAVFHSPVVHTPQEGKAKVFAYLSAADGVFADTGFNYTRMIVDGDTAVLEFTANIDGIHVNGIDMIHWNGDGLIDDFKVMVRPMKAMNMLWDKMGAMLASQQPASS
ncbi:MAG: nuclear transport factor 2 family protein [Pacificimonas sp.]